MQKRTFKSFIALFGLGLLLSQNAQALPGFGKKAPRAERIAAQLSGAPVNEALAMAPEDHINDSNTAKCLTLGKNGENIATFAGMAQKGCFPDGTKYPALSKIRTKFCLKNCVNGTKEDDKCKSNDPDNLKKLCNRYCSTQNLGSERAHKLLAQCFSAWSLNKDSDDSIFKDITKGWNNANSVNFPLTHDEATQYEGWAKGRKASQAEETKQSAGEIKEYKAAFQPVATNYVRFIKERGDLEEQLDKTLEAYSKFEEKLKEIESKKKELQDAQLDLNILNDEENKMLRSKLSKEHKDETFNVSTNSIGTNRTLAELIAGLHTSTKKVTELAKEQKSAAGEENFSKAMKKANVLARVRAKARKAKTEAEVKGKVDKAEKTVEEMDDSTKARLGSANPLFGRRKK